MKDYDREVSRIMNSFGRGEGERKPDYRTVRRLRRAYGYVDESHRVTLREIRGLKKNLNLN